MSLVPIMTIRAFPKWGRDFVGPTKLSLSFTYVEFIIVATQYLTKWVELKTTLESKAKGKQKNEAKTIFKFLHDNVFT